MDMEVYFIVYTRGSQVSKFVRNHFVEELKKNANFKKKKYDLALKETFYRMDEMLVLPESIRELKKYTKQQKDSYYDDESNAGCTAVVMLLTKNDEIHVANAGDSRCILCRSGTAIPLSFDHKPNLEIEMNRISKAGGKIEDGRVNGGLNLTRALGDLEYKCNINLPKEEQLIVATPDLQKSYLTNDDEFILLGCDGIFEKKTTEENIKDIRSLLSKGKPLKTIMENTLDSLLAEDTKEGAGLDNMTAIIIKLNKKRKSITTAKK